MMRYRYTLVSEAEMDAVARRTIMEAFKPSGIDWVTLDDLYLRHATPLQNLRYWCVKNNIKFNNYHKTS